MVFHVLCNHLLRVKFSLAQITLEVSCSMNLFMFGEIGRIAERFVAKSAFVEGKFGVFA